MIEQTAPTAALLTSIAALINAIAWPAVAAWFLFSHRRSVSHLIDIFGTKVQSARKLKFGQIELEQEIDAGVRDAREGASTSDPPKTVPGEQIKAAVELQAKVQTADIPRTAVLETVRIKLNLLASEYEAAREEMRPGLLRTRRMNEIAAGMRALGLTALPLWSDLAESRSAGKRLAAICILQVSPDKSRFDWLIERIKQENQPFLFYQAALAILELVRGALYSSGDQVRSAIKDAIQFISAFEGGEPDRNTLDILNEALFLVR